MTITLAMIHKKLAEAIQLSGMTQTEIADKLGVTQSAIAHYVRGSKMPALDTLANLCRVLDIDSNDILCLSDNS